MQAQIRPQQQAPQQQMAGMPNMRPAIPSQPQITSQAQMQAQMQASQAQSQPQFSAAYAASGEQMAPAAAGQSLQDDLQQWKNALDTVTVPFVFKGQQHNLTMHLARVLLARFEALGDTANTEELRKVCIQLLQSCRQVTGKSISQENLQMLLQATSTTAASAAQHTPAPAPAPAPAATPAQPAAQLADVRMTPTLGSAIAANGVQVSRSVSNMSANMLSSPAMGMSVPASGAGLMASGAQQHIPLSAPAGSAAVPAPAAGAAASTAVKSQASSKNSPSVSSTKSKKKSQSPRTTAKARKGASPKATPATSTASPQQPQQPPPLMPAPTAAAPVVALTTAAPDVQGVNPMPGEQAAMSRKASISAESAVTIVESVKSTVHASNLANMPYKTLAEDQKKAIREALPTIERMVSSIGTSLPTLYMSTMDKKVVAQIYSIELIVKEQARLLADDLFIIVPDYLMQSRRLLVQAVTTIKNWASGQRGSMKHPSSRSNSQEPAAPTSDAKSSVTVKQEHLQQKPQEEGKASMGDVKADQQTPLTNLHPGAMTADPSLEPFQKAAKHPLDPVNLRLPAAKKRATNKGSIAGGAMTSPAAPASLSGQPQAQQQHLQGQKLLGPAVPMLPPGMTQEGFDRLPMEERAAIFQQQQSLLIKQHAVGMKPTVPPAQLAIAAAIPTQQQQQQQQQPQAESVASDGLVTSSHLWAALQDISATSAQTTEEQNLKRLEQDKWNNPLEYLMGVLDKFTKGTEKAGVEPAPILQQAFWPIARKSMSSGWGVVAADAVL
ncbi:hypothetical protein GQ54DRAFT_340820 [Martensiomyces pterosporus]|nr:hypothetical protein GQ54DRAFT_340820 [Martensiomyces pterosporus]